MKMRKVISTSLILLLHTLVWSPLGHCDGEDNWFPNYHVAPRKGWMNDPNGFIYHNGYYHLFFQSNPDATAWGFMRWGHARSKDLLTWEYLPIALTPSLPDDIDGIFSGSAVIKDDKLTILYTGASESYNRQRIMAAYSTNDIEFEKLGVVIVKEGDEHDFRDPKAWFQDNFWYAVIGTRTNDNRGQIVVYKSENFINWTYDGILAESNEKMGFMWECPDLITLENKQILIVNPQGMHPDGYDFNNLYQSGYYVGSWVPGTPYTMETEFKEIDHGHDFYATYTFLAPDGRRILIAWMSMWGSIFPESSKGWATMMTIPREITLSKSGKLESRPIREIRNARVNRFMLSQHIIIGDKSVKLIDRLISSEVRIDFNLKNTTSDLFGFTLGSNDFLEPFEGVKVYVNRSISRLFLQRNYPQYNIPLSTRSIAIDLNDPLLSLDIFVDKSSIEIFINDGQGVMSSRIYPNNDQRTFHVYGGGLENEVNVASYSIWDIVV